MTENVKGIILRHRQVLLSEDVKSQYDLKEREIFSAATLPELDDAYTKKLHNFNSITDLYNWSSSANYLNNISTPMVFINALDDPIVPEPLLDTIRTFVGKFSYIHTLVCFIIIINLYSGQKKNALYVELAHGGHLGFYEGGLLYPNPVTWLDKALVALIGGLVLHHNDSPLKAVSS